MFQFFHMFLQLLCLDATISTPTEALRKCRKLSHGSRKSSEIMVAMCTKKPWGAMSHGPMEQRTATGQVDAKVKILCADAELYIAE